MKNQSAPKHKFSNVFDYDFSQEDFSEIHLTVETLLSSIEKKKKVKAKVPSIPRKKWKRKNKKEREDIGIRELPFTF